MNPFLKREFQFLAKPLNAPSRIFLLIGAALLLASFFFPLWQIHLVAPQYQEGLHLDIYAHRIEAGNKGNDLNEINNLNHYIGMKPIQEEDFMEMKWMPFALGLFMLFALRAAVFGMMRYVVDLFATFSYFGLFSLISFYYRMYSYGHHLNPKAPVKITPFTPVIIGDQQIANFTQSSWPQISTFLLAGYAACLLIAIWASRKETL
ncbi:hypothetical protein ACXR0O_22855 [Verrucomicrobiota bacterium sgz303538]